MRQCSYGQYVAAHEPPPLICHARVCSNVPKLNDRFSIAQHETSELRDRSPADVDDVGVERVLFRLGTERLGVVPCIWSCQYRRFAERPCSHHVCANVLQVGSFKRSFIMTPCAKLARPLTPFPAFNLEQSWDANCISRAKLDFERT